MDQRTTPEPPDVTATETHRLAITPGIEAPASPSPDPAFGMPSPAGLPDVSLPGNRDLLEDEVEEEAADVEGLVEHAARI